MNIKIPGKLYKKMLEAGAADLKTSIEVQGNLLTGGPNQQDHLECAVRDIFVKMADQIGFSIEVGE